MHARTHTHTHTHIQRRSTFPGKLRFDTLASLFEKTTERQELAVPDTS